MQIVVAYPPLIDEIDAKFHVRGRPCFFAWGDTLYNPLNFKVPPEIIAHEHQHRLQQELDTSIESWWRRYIADEPFRWDMEVAAHRLELQSLLYQNGNNRHARRAFHAQTARRLVASIYQWERRDTRTAMRALEGAMS